MNNNKIKFEKGITLITLIITIVILIILAAVAIGTIDDVDTIDYTQNTVNNYEIESAKEKLREEVLEWQLVKGETLKVYLTRIYGSDNVTDYSSGSVKVIVSNGIVFVVNEKGEATFIETNTGNGGNNQGGTSEGNSGNNQGSTSGENSGNNQGGTSGGTTETISFKIDGTTYEVTKGTTWDSWFLRNGWEKWRYSTSFSGYDNPYIKQGFVGNYEEAATILVLDTSKYNQPIEPGEYNTMQAYS